MPSSSSSFLTFILPLILSRIGSKRLRRIIWRSRILRVHLNRYHDQYSVLLVHPLTCLYYGIAPGQICRVSFEIQKDKSKIVQLDRLIRIRYDSSLSPGYSSLSSHDIFNILGYSPINTVSIKDIVAYSRLSQSSHLRLADRLRVATVITAKKEAIQKDGQVEGGITQLLNTPRVVYNGDIVTITINNLLEGTKERISYRLDCSPLPSCLIDSRVSIYETSSIHSLSPFGSSYLPLPILPPSINNLLSSMISICYAHSQISHSSPLSFLIHGSSGSGKRVLINSLAANTHRNFIEVNCLDIWSEVSSQGEHKLKTAIQKACSIYPCILYLSNIDALGYDAQTRSIDSRVCSVLRSCLEDTTKSGQITVVLGCTSRQLSSLSQSIRESVLYEMSLPSLSEDDRRYYISSLIHSSTIATSVAKNTSGFVMCELLDLISDARCIAYENGRKEISLHDMELSIERRNACIASSVGTAKVPNVSWEDIGGLEDTKKVLRESIQACLKGGNRMKRSGIVLFGPPGCGKTLLAKAVATEYKIAFLSVKGPELLNKYVGQSEENLRNVFERAKEASPCVIFFDELDSIAPNRGRHGDSGGVMDRIVSQLLSELDDLQSQKESQVFIMGATNRADLLDPSLLSPGRFDKIVNVSPGQDVQSKTKILQALSRSVQLGDDVDMKEVAESCPPVMSGAELYSIVSNATMSAIREQVSLIESGELKEKEANLRICQRHLIQSLNHGRHLI